MENTWKDSGGGPDGWERLAPGVARRRLPFLDVTIGVVVGTEGVLVIDTGSTLREGEQLRREVTELTGRPVTDLVLTHGHFDHVLGSGAFPGARIHAQRALAVRMARVRGDLQDDAVRYGVSPDEASRAAAALVAPHNPVDEWYELDLGDREVLLVHPGDGHTDHDLVVVVPGTPTVVFCGDLVEESGEPQAGPDSVARDWPATLDRLLELGGETAVYVPGHGAAVDARFVRAQRAELARRFGVG